MPRRWPCASAFRRSWQPAWRAGIPIAARWSWPPTPTRAWSCIRHACASGPMPSCQGNDHPRQPPRPGCHHSRQAIAAMCLEAGPLRQRIVVARHGRAGRAFRTGRVPAVGRQAQHDIGQGGASPQTKARWRAAHVQRRGSRRGCWPRWPTGRHVPNCGAPGPWKALRRRCWSSVRQSTVPPLPAGGLGRQQGRGVRCAAKRRQMALFQHEVVSPGSPAPGRSLSVRNAAESSARSPCPQG